MSSRQTFSPKSYKQSESDDSLQSLNSVIIERENPRPSRIHDEVDLFYAQLSISFYNHKHEKKTPRSAIINNQFKTTQSSDRQISKRKTESFKGFKDFKQTYRPPSSNTVSTAESQPYTTSMQSYETLSRKAAEIVNRATPAISIHQKSQPLKKVNENLFKILSRQGNKTDFSPAGSCMSQRSFRQNEKLLQLLTSPYQTQIKPKQQQKHPIQAFKDYGLKIQQRK